MHKGVKKEKQSRYIYVGLQKEKERRRPLVKRQLVLLLAGIMYMMCRKKSQRIPGME